MPYHKMTEEEKAESRRQAAARYRSRHKEKIAKYQKENIKRYQVSFTPETGRRIEEAAAAVGLSAHALIKTVILSYLDSERTEENKRSFDREDGDM